jgi:hypothetical protein
MRLAIHLLLFLVISLVIVLLSALFAEPEDGSALRSVPRRLGMFVLGCSLLAAVILFFEHTFASVD